MSKNVVQPLAVENYLHNGERACVNLKKETLKNFKRPRFP